MTDVVVHPRYTEASTSGFDIAVYKVDAGPLDGKVRHGQQSSVQYIGASRWCRRNCGLPVYPTWIVIS